MGCAIRGRGDREFWPPRRLADSVAFRMPNADSIPPPSMPPVAHSAEVVSRGRTIDPDLWVAVFAWLVVIFCCIQVLLFSYGRDQSIYAVVADGIVHGQMPYRDLWDFKTPGIFLVFALAQLVFGKTMLAIRLVEVAGLLAVAFSFRAMAEILLERRRVGDVAAAVAAFSHANLEFWHTAQPEAFGGFLIVFALLITVGDYPRWRRFVQWTAMGLLFGAAFVMKPTLGGGALVCAVYLARREYVRTGRYRDAVMPPIIAGLASLLPILMVLLWFKAAGAWPAFAWTFFEFTPGYTALYSYFTATEAFYYALHELFFRFAPLTAIGVLAAIAIRPMHQREREGMLLLLGVCAINVAGIAMQNKFFQYHYSSTLPLVCFISGVGYYKLWRRLFIIGPGGVVAYVSLLVVLASMRSIVWDLGDGFWERSRLRMGYLLRGATSHARLELDRKLYKVADYDLGANRDAALEVENRVPEGQSIFVWGFEPGIYWMSGRPPASRFIYNVPQRAKWERERARDMLMSDLTHNMPAMILVQHGDRFQKVTGNSLDSAQALYTFPQLETFMDRNYSPAGEVAGKFDLYRRSHNK